MYVVNCISVKISSDGLVLQFYLTFKQNCMCVIFRLYSSATTVPGKCQTWNRSWKLTALSISNWQRFFLHWIVLVSIHVV